METNQNPEQMQSVQPEIAAAEPLYDPAEAARIVQTLTDDRYFEPEYVLLFGRLAGGTPHSEVAAYDLLLVCRETPVYNWIDAKRILRYKLPYNKRRINYINLYITTPEYYNSVRTPFLYFAHAEGELLYCSDRCHFRRPKRPVNFAAVCADARSHFDTFRIMGNELLEQANEAWFDRRNRRLAALFAAQAMVCFYHTLYYVYHGEAFDKFDPVVMHERMRTLSARLMLAFDNNHVERIFTLPCLKEYLNKARYDVRFDIEPQELELHLDRVQRAAGIIENCCELRLELYRGLCE